MTFTTLLRAMIQSFSLQWWSQEWIAEFGDAANDASDAWLAGPRCFLFANLRHSENDHDNNMAVSSIQALAVPRFLLPQLSWSAKATTPAAMTALGARQYRTGPPAERCAIPSITAPFKHQAIRQWRGASPQWAAGYDAALSFRRSFSASAPMQKDHHFDTLKFVQRLKEEGFTEEQAEGMMRVLGDVIEER
jgi:hypothetical protein